ncbi:MAG: hypothetical protein KJ550_03730 [Proteobacteria bacterium]|nr:hypothetical protein [Desulfobacteraceae bacterium]MBU4012556.1 hypothetical protein [Pseudomonadota bacterium]MBU4068326.1 hypothetical protein [Pseudomonadota bacterium]MBU4099983.1 hypothetical protein [Pseudomonadota bacterium]
MNNNPTRELEILHTAQSGSGKEKILCQEEKIETGWEAIYGKNCVPRQNWRENLLIWVFQKRLLKEYCT